MIELPKYTVPTYDPHALAPNQHTDFTRRIPTGFTQRQLDRDARIILQIVRAYDEGGRGAAERVLDIFLRKAKLLTNPRYWEMMRTVWVAAGSTETADIFRTMMKSARPCRSWFMTPEDAQALDAMQFPLTVWRAYDVKYIVCTEDIHPSLDGSPGETTDSDPIIRIEAGDIVDLPNSDPGISWTIDKEWCIGYARSKGRVVRERQVMRSDIFAYITRRGESEMIIL